MVIPPQAGFDEFLFLSFILRLLSWGREYMCLLDRSKWLMICVKYTGFIASGNRVHWILTRVRWFIWVYWLQNALKEVLIKNISFLVTRYRICFKRRLIRKVALYERECAVSALWLPNLLHFLWIHPKGGNNYCIQQFLYIRSHYKCFQFGVLKIRYL